MSGYFLEPSLESPVALTSPQNQRLLEFLPSYWFLAIFNQLNRIGAPRARTPGKKRLDRHRCGCIRSLRGAACCCATSASCEGSSSSQTSFALHARSLWPPQWGNPLTQAITFFSLRTLMRSRQHRMMLGFYLGLGVSCAVGYANAYLGGFRSAGTTISVSFLLVTIVTTILTVFSLRVIASLPISLSRSELGHPHYTNPAGARLPESCSDIMAGIRSRAAVVCC